MKPLAEVLPAMKPTTKPSECETGPDRQKPERNSIGSPRGETGSSVTVMTANPNQRETMPTVSEPLPTLRSEPHYASLKGAWEVAKIIPMASLISMRDHIETMMTPASPATSLAWIERLAVHYPRQPRNDREAELLYEDWADDLAGLPADIVAAACAQYRNTPARFMATPGQIRGLAEPIATYRKRLHDRANELLSEKVKP